MYYNIFFKLNRINVLNTLYISTFLQIIIFRVHHSISQINLRGHILNHSNKNSASSPTLSTTSLNPPHSLSDSKCILKIVI